MTVCWKKEDWIHGSLVVACIHITIFGIYIYIIEKWGHWEWRVGEWPDIDKRVRRRRRRWWW